MILKKTVVIPNYGGAEMSVCPMGQGMLVVTIAANASMTFEINAEEFYRFAAAAWQLARPLEK